jgi:hypothetical protein
MGIGSDAFDRRDRLNVVKKQHLTIIPRGDIILVF